MTVNIPIIDISQTSKPSYASNSTMNIEIVNVVLYAKQKQQGCKKRVPPSKVGSIVQLVTTRTDIKLQPSS